MKTIFTANAPKPIGPYSQGIIVDKTLYISGQVAIDPSTGEMQQESIEAETRQVMSNLEAILESQGLKFANVIKCSIFLTDMGDFSKVNEIYGSYCIHFHPVRETVQVSALPAGARVEISAIAHIG
jgi:2-iminobutanoate/2-iminopropanoate deaminase